MIREKPGLNWRRFGLVSLAIVVALAALVAGSIAVLRQVRSLVRHPAPHDGRPPNHASATPIWFAGVPLFPGRQRDQVPPVDQPLFASEPANSAALSAEDLVVGVEVGGSARAYPLWILSRCEIVNDRFGSQPVCVTYCPLSASTVVFEARVEDRSLVFGNEGSLYEGNLVMYDREGGSLWYQLRGLAIAGPQIHRSLPRLPATLTRWEVWRRRHPTGSILVGDRKAGRFFRMGDEDSVTRASHPQAQAPFAPISREDPRLPAMGEVLGFQGPNGAACLAEELIRTLSAGHYDIPGAGRVNVLITADREVRITGPGGAEIPVVPAFWFAWHAAFPTGGVISNLVPARANRMR